MRKALRSKTMLACAGLGVLLASGGVPAQAQGTSLIFYSVCFEVGCSIYRANLDGSNPQQLVASGTGGDLDYDVMNGRLYFSGLPLGIQSSAFDGSGQKTVISDVIFVSALEVDPIGGKLYFVGGLPAEWSIHRANLDGSELETVVASELEVFGMAVDPVHQKLYWTASQGLASDDGTLLRANLDGSNAEVLIAAADLGGQFRPGAVSVNPQGRLYVVDRREPMASVFVSRIFEADLDGGNPHLVIDGNDYPGLEVSNIDLGSFIYFTARDVQDAGVWRSNGNGTVVEVLIPHEGEITVVADLALGIPPGEIVPASSAWSSVVLAAFLLAAASMVLARRRASLR